MIKVDHLPDFTIISPHKTLKDLPKFYFLCYFSCKVHHQKLVFHYSKSFLKGCSAPANFLAMLIISYIAISVNKFTDKSFCTLWYSFSVCGGFMRAIRELTQQDGWKTQDSKTAKKNCGARLCIPNLTRHFFVTLPSWVFQPSSCVSSVLTMVCTRSVLFYEKIS